MSIERDGEASCRDGGKNCACGEVQRDHPARLSNRLGHGIYHTGDMVRERVGDWKLAWRFALAGMMAGLLVIALAQTGVTAGTFDAGQDRLFPAPAPDPGITLVEILVAATLMVVVLTAPNPTSRMPSFPVATSIFGGFFTTGNYIISRSRRP